MDGKGFETGDRLDVLVVWKAGYIAGLSILFLRSLMTRGRVAFPEACRRESGV